MKKNLQLGLIIVFGYATSAACGCLQKQVAATYMYFRSSSFR